MTYGGTFAVVAGVLTVTYVAAWATTRKSSPVKPDGEPGTTDPERLAAAAGIPLSVYALARVLASEENKGRLREKTAIAWVVRNEAAARNKTIAEVVLRADTAHAGTFGSQNQGRFVSSAKPPAPEDITIARAVLASDGPDPTLGARQYDHPKAQNALVASGADGYRFDADALAQRRLVNNTMIVVDGIDPRRLRFWRPRATSDTGVA